MYYSYNGLCLPSCPPGTTPIIPSMTSLGQRTCQPCPSNCLNCIYLTSSQTIFCTRCNTSWYLVRGVCHQTCPQTTYPSPTSFSCLPCGIIGCQTCRLNSTFLVECTSCQGGYYMVVGTGICVTGCPMGYSLIGA